MARTLSTVVSNAIDDTVTAPRYLVELGWSTTVRLCSRETLSWNGYTWTGDSVVVQSLRGDNADQTAQLVLPNHDDGFGALALSEGLSDVPVRIWMLYGDAPHAVEDAELLFDGSSDGGSITLRTVSIACRAMRDAMMYAPRLYLTPPLVNHAPAAGTTLRWGGDSYVLERRR